MQRVFLAAIALAVWAAFLAPGRPALAEEPVSYEEDYGAAAGLALYDAHTLLCVLAGAFSKEAYTPEEASQIIAEQKAGLAVIDDYAKRLMESATGSDRASLSEIRDCVAGVDAAADALKAYVDASSAATADAYRKRSEASYTALAKFLGSRTSLAGPLPWDPTVPGFRGVLPRPRPRTQLSVRPGRRAGRHTIELDRLNHFD